MQDFIFIVAGAILFGGLGFYLGQRHIVARAEAAAQDFIDALRERFGTTITRDVLVDGVTEPVEFVELPDDLEELGDALFNLK